MSVYNAKIHVTDSNGTHDIQPITAISNVLGLSAALNEKANSSHSHTTSDILDFPSETTLPDRSDLNDCTLPDTIWVCLSASSAADISNTPWISGGFRVWNEPITSKSGVHSGGLFYQCLIPNNADTTLIYRRKYDGGKMEPYA